MDAEGIERAVVLAIRRAERWRHCSRRFIPIVSIDWCCTTRTHTDPLRDHPKPAAGRRAAEMMLERLRHDWGTGRALSMWVQGVTDVDAAARFERSACTPAGIVQYMESNFRIDVRPVLPLVQAPTLVVHGTHDQIIPFFFAELFRDRIPDAELVAVDMGHGSFEPGGDEAALTTIETWLTGHAAQEFTPVERVLSTVLFTDVVGSTAMASRLGDARWKNLLDRHDDVCRRAVGTTAVNSSSRRVTASLRPSMGLAERSTVPRRLPRTSKESTCGSAPESIPARSNDARATSEGSPSTWRHAS